MCDFTSIPDGYKQCSRCHQNKPATTEYFSRRSTARDGLNAMCKDCISDREGGKRRQSSLPTPLGMKRCSKCKEIKPATKEYFSGKQGGVHGLRPECKNCQRRDAADYKARNSDQINERERARYAANIEKEHERSRKYTKSHPQKTQERVRRWNEAHPEQREERERKRREKDKDKDRKRQRDWGCANPLKVRAKYHRRRSKKQGHEATLTANEWQQALDYFGGCCAVCGRAKDFWTVIAADHWIPVSDQRPDNPGTVATNIIPLCHARKGVPAGEPSCNQSKSNKDPVQWLIEKLGKQKANKKLTEIEAYFSLVRKTE